MKVTEDDNWLNAKTIQCPECEKQLDLIDQSPFDPDCYLYCMKCRNRIDISRYDRHWKLAEDFVFERDGLKTDKMTLGQLATQFETMVGPCNCGGIFRYAAPRRCLYCAAVLADADSHQHVWPEDVGDDEQALADGDALIARFVREPKWLDDC